MIETRQARVRFRNRVASIRSHLDVALSLLSSAEQERDYVGLATAHLKDVAWRAFRAAVEAEGLREFLLDEEGRSDAADGSAS